MKDSINLTLVPFSLISLILLSACGGSGGNIDTSVPDPKGLFSLRLTDAAVDGATEVVVKFNAIELKPKQGDSITITFDEAKSIDLLALQNGNTVSLLDDLTLDSGEYNWIRLQVDAEQGQTDSYISFDDGMTYSLYIPSGNTTGLKLNRSFIVPVGGSADFTIDFDLRKSVLNPGNNSDDYKLKPTLRIVDNSEVGSIAGFIAGSLVSDPACNEGLAVYAYDGTGITPDDEGSSTSPLTSAIPEYDADNDQFNYKLSFLSAGTYTLALTCDAEFDDPETDEDPMVWSALSTSEATVSEDQTTQVNFE